MPKVSVLLQLDQRKIGFSLFYIFRMDKKLTLWLVVLNEL